MLSKIINDAQSILDLPTTVAIDQDTNMASPTSSPLINMQRVEVKPLEASPAKTMVPKFLTPEFNKDLEDNFNPKSFAILYKKDMRGVYCQDSNTLNYAIHELIN